MGRTFEGIDDTLSAFIRRQHIFFVATAPLAADGHVNLSPKGQDTFAIIDPNTVAYLDLTGSGVETIAHLRENGRIVVMFCSFEGAPKILRLHGRGEVIEIGDDRFDELRGLFPHFDGARSVIRIAVERIADSCGYGVPLYEFQGERMQLIDWAERKGPEAVVKYRAEKNRTSIDGLPGFEGG